MPVTYARSVRPYAWDQIALNDDLGMVEGTITDAQIKERAFAVDDYGDWYLRDSPYGGRIGHPLLLADDIVRLFFLGYDCRPPYAGGLHAKNIVWLRGPIRLGEHVTLTGHHVRKYERRGMQYRVLAGAATTDDGRVLLQVEATETVGFRRRELTKPPQRTVSGAPRTAREEPLSKPYAMVGDHAIAVGMALPPIVKHVTLQQSTIFSGFPFSWALDDTPPLRIGIHTDNETAQEAGAPRPIIQGLVFANHISEMCITQFGRYWLESGSLETTFLRPALVGTTLRSEAIVANVVGSGIRTKVELSVSTKTLTGELIMAGTARLAIPRDHSRKSPGDGSGRIPQDVSPLNPSSAGMDPGGGLPSAVRGRVPQGG